MRKLAVILLPALFGLFVLAACSRRETEDNLMKAGLDALYARKDPHAAAEQFRKALERNPNHYEATYQLATALDRAGKPAEARPYWEKTLRMAEASRDEKTAAVARARLGSPRSPDPEGDLMKAGVDALYARNAPEAAAEQFRKVLERNPAHYGANYQLATALDRAGKPAEARPLWEKVLKMAAAYNDATTATTARARLERRP